MLPLDFSFQQKYIFRCGTIFYGHIPNITSNEPHYLVLLNNTPSSDTQYCFLVATSQNWNVKYIQDKFGIDTVVKIPKNNKPFTKDTYLNCNDVKVMELKDVKNKYIANDIKTKDELAKEYIDLVIKGVKLSNQVPNKIKKLLPDSL